MSVQQVIPMRYTDSDNLYKHLRSFFPAEDFAVHTEMGSYMLCLSRYLTESEVANIKRHYERRSKRRAPRS